MAFKRFRILSFFLAVTICSISLAGSSFAKGKNITQNEPYHLMITPRSSENVYGTQDNGNRYDLSFINYDQDFAEEFGLSPIHITDMDSGLRLVEAKVVTEGQITNCYYNFVLDKSIKIDFPAENYQVKHMIKESGMLIPRSTTIGTDTFKNIIEQSSEKKPFDFKYNAKTFIFSKTYDNIRYMNSTLLVIAYIVSSPFPYQILITEIPCSSAFYTEKVSTINLGLVRSGFDKIKDDPTDYYYKLNFPESMINSLKSVPKISISYPHSIGR